jgi:hypothetical protein
MRKKSLEIIGRPRSGGRPSLSARLRIVRDLSEINSKRGPVHRAAARIREETRSRDPQETQSMQEDTWSRDGSIGDASIIPTISQSTSDTWTRDAGESRSVDELNSSARLMAALSLNQTNRR